MNQNAEMAVAILGEDLIIQLAKGLARARALHPIFARSPLKGYRVIQEEVEELGEAICMESPERQREEAVDVIVTGIRFLLGEHLISGVQLTDYWVDEAPSPGGKP